MARAKKNAPRHACGKVIQPTATMRQQDMVQVATEGRARAFGLSIGQASDSLAGTPHGRARLRWRQGDSASGITATQYEAAEAFAKRRRSYLSVVTSNLPSYGSVLDAIIANGRGMAADPADEVIARVRDDHAEIVGALQDAGQMHTFHAMTNILAFDVDPGDYAAWPLIRGPLNAIAVRLKISVPDDARKGKGA